MNFKDLPIKGFHSAASTSAIVLLMLCAAAILVPTRAEAQAHCGFTCDYYTSQCSKVCYDCLLDYPDGYCPQEEIEWTTCGEYTNYFACLQCAPNWQSETIQIGRFATDCFVENGFHKCWIKRAFTKESCDQNQCNTNPDYYCHPKTCHEAYVQKVVMQGGLCTAQECCAADGQCWGTACGTNIVEDTGDGQTASSCAEPPVDEDDLEPTLSSMG